MTKPRISIIILSYNTKNLLRETLRSIERANTKGLRVQTIVVDNASSDGSPKMVKEDFPWIELLVNNHKSSKTGVHFMLF